MIPDPQLAARHDAGGAAADRDAVLAALTAADSVVITSHSRPDGDAIGTSLGAAHLLRSMGKQATVCFADPVPDAFMKLPGAAEIQSALPPAGSVDALLVIECDSFARTGYDADALRALAPLTINIDHHLSGKPFAALNWIDPAASAAGAMLGELATRIGRPMTSELCTCLYAALITDTGSFTYQTTTAATFELAANLLHCGADAYAISQQVFSSNRLPKLHITATMLQRVQVHRTVGWSYITEQDRATADATIEDCEGLVNHVISLREADVAVLFREEAPGLLRTSLRSKGTVDVAKLAERFGGGGHHNAAGCILHGTPAEAIAAVLAALDAQGEAVVEAQGGALDVQGEAQASASAGAAAL